MTTFWSTIAHKLTHDEAMTKYSEQLSLLEDAENAEFSFGSVPNLGPGGATSDEDEEDLAERDPDEEIDVADGPTLGDEKALMAYFPEVDELFLFSEEENEWVLWNY